VFPIENVSLKNYVHGVEQKSPEAVDQMNTVIANFLLDLTAGSRFSGKMNVDLREIETNMVPFPNHKFLCSGISPIATDNAPRNVTGFFTEAMSRKATLCDVDAHAGMPSDQQLTGYREDEVPALEPGRVEDWALWECPVVFEVFCSLLDKHKRN
jgi:hypothetical protein